MFPRELVKELILYFLSKEYSYREIQEIFKEIKKYTYPSLGFISKVARHEEDLRKTLGKFTSN